jgi:ornithine cyclodeaminase/alanine dehydrogenase-like protein (mu-crystallin family)
MNGKVLYLSRNDVDMARPDSSVIGILGCGVQGESNLKSPYDLTKKH